MMDAEDDVYRQSIPELISSLRTAFRASDFEHVKLVWLARERALKGEIEVIEEERQFEMLENIRMKNELESLKQKLAELEKKLAEFEESRSRSQQELRNVDAGDQGVRGGSNGIGVEDDMKISDNGKVGSGLKDSQPEAEKIEKSNKCDMHVESNNRPVSGCTTSKDGGANPKDTVRSLPGHIVEILDSDDELAYQPCAINSQSDQLAIEVGPEQQKRKRNSSVNDSVTSNHNDQGDNDHSATCGIKKMKREIVTPVSDGGVYGHQESVPAKINVGAESTCSRVNKVLCGQSDDKLTKEASNRHLDSDSDDNLSYSDSDDNTDCSFDFSVLLRKNKAAEGDKKWEIEADMIASFGKDLELCMKAICVLYRQQNSEIVSCGLNEHDAIRVTALAEFLIDGDPEGRMKRSVAGLTAYDKNAAADCRRIAIQHSEQLFEMYQEQGGSMFLL